MLLIHRCWNVHSRLILSVWGHCHYFFWSSHIHRVKNGSVNKKKYKFAQTFTWALQVHFPFISLARRLSSISTQPLSHLEHPKPFQMYPSLLLHGHWVLNKFTACSILHPRTPLAPFSLLDLYTEFQYACSTFNLFIVLCLVASCGQ